MSKKREDLKKPDLEIWSEVRDSLLKTQEKIKIFNRLKQEGNLQKRQKFIDEYFINIKNKDN